MSEEVQERRRWGWLVVVLLILVVYFLSLGPAAMIHARLSDQHAREIIESIYFPLKLIYDNVPPSQPVFDGYMQLWI